MVTVTGVAMHLPIAWLIATDRLVIGGVLLIIFGLFDTLDGELARLQHKASEAGMLLDASTDRIKEVLLYTGIASWLATSAQPSWACVAVIACGASITVSYVKAKGEVALAARQKDMDHHQINSYYKEGLVPFEIRMLILVIGLLSGYLLAVTIVIAVLATYTVFERLYYITGKL
jgi:phosphatidylglycerophosphate synthase